MKKLMPGQSIVIRIDPATGETSLEAVGFGGLGCRDASRPFEDALGVTGERSTKPAAYRSGQDEIRLEARGSS
jgi:Protein of unknown function (DUF2997)